jgi:hypothetical protein
MATTATMTDTRPKFSRLTSGRATTSWKAAIPAVIVVCLFVALLGYLASSLSSASQRAASAERDMKATQEQSAGLTKQIGTLQKDVAVAKSPGRTTVVLQPTDKKAKDGTWATVTWGELQGGKSWARVNAYGLKDAPGKQLHGWFLPASGEPVQIGVLEADADGNGFAMNSTLPAIDQGKSVVLSLDADGAKAPEQVIAQADLPKLSPTMKQAPPAADALPQARTGETTQPMHKDKAK